MLDAGTPQAAGSWLEQNIGRVIEFLVIFAGAVAAWANLKSEVKGVKDQQDEQCERLEKVEQHVSDTSRHRDPERDEKRLQGIEADVKEILREVRRGGGRQGHGGSR